MTRFGWLVLVCSTVVGGCGTVGSVDIAHARSSYSDVIRRTDDEQLLRMIVQTRFGESSGLLVVSNVTSNLSVRGSFGAQAGFGPSDNFAGNLVPLSAGVEYTENPTISYIPKQGQQYLREMLAPLSLETVTLLAGARGEPGWILSTCVEEVNGVRNADIGKTGGADSFTRACTLLTSLSSDHVVVFARSPSHEDDISMVFRQYAPARVDDVQEFLQLLQLDPALADGKSFELPVRLAVHAAGEASVDLLTRSPYDLLRLAAAGVMVTEEDMAVTDPLLAQALAPQAGGLPPLLRVHFSTERPGSAVTAIEHRGRWYYLDDADWTSKQGFLMLRDILLTRVQNQESGTAPVLTIPVGR